MSGSGRCSHMFLQGTSRPAVQKITTRWGIVLYPSRVAGMWVLPVVIFPILPGLRSGDLIVTDSQVAVVMKLHCLRKNL